MYTCKMTYFPSPLSQGLPVLAGTLDSKNPDLNYYTILAWNHTSISRIGIWNREKKISFPNAESIPGALYVKQLSYQRTSCNVAFI